MNGMIHRKRPFAVGVSVALAVLGLSGVGLCAAQASSCTYTVGNSAVPSSGLSATTGEGLLCPTTVISGVAGAAGVPATTTVGQGEMSANVAQSANSAAIGVGQAGGLVKLGITSSGSGSGSSGTGTGTGTGSPGTGSGSGSTGSNPSGSGSSDSGASGPAANSGSSTSTAGGSGSGTGSASAVGSNSAGGTISGAGLTSATGSAPSTSSTSADRPLGTVAGAKLNSGSQGHTVPNSMWWLWMFLGALLAMLLAGLVIARRRRSHSGDEDAAPSMSSTK